MISNRRYLVGVALFAVLAAAFGVLGTVAPPLAETNLVQPQQEPSESVGHFQNPPTYDSGWVDISDKRGQTFSITHDLNSREVLVDIVGRQVSDGDDHKVFFGATTFVQGWEKTYGEATADSSALCLVQTSDGGYALAGYLDSYGPSGSDFWLIKTDAAGGMQWDKTYGGTGSDRADSLVQTVDGGYALAGRTRSYGAGLDDFWLVKTDSAGNMEWSQTYGSAGVEVAMSIVQTSDGGYALAGSFDDLSGYGGGALLVKTDSAGNQQWAKEYGGTSADVANSIVQTVDGGYALCGGTASYGDSKGDAWLVKTDSDGNVVWDETYGGGESDRGCSVVQTSDRGYVFAGVTRSFGAGGADFYLVKTDSLGNLIWSKTYGGGATDDVAEDVVQTPDDGYAIIGSIATVETADIWLIKTDQSGNVQWDNTYDGGSFPVALVQTIDGGYAIAGFTYQYTLLIKTEVGEMGLSIGLSMISLTDTEITLYRGIDDPFWNYVRIRIWTIKEPSWMYGDVNMDGAVDAKDLYILGRNYGKSISLLSLGGIIGLAGIRTVKKRKQAD